MPVVLAFYTLIAGHLIGCRKNNKLCGNFQEHYAEESVDYAENTLDYAENFQLASLAKTHIFSCSRNRAAPEGESLLVGSF